MPPATDVDALIDGLLVDAAAATEAGRHAEAARLYRAAIALRQQADDARRLPAANQRGNISEMVTAERVRVSKGRKKRDALVAAANTKNYTLRSLAEKLEAEGFQVSHALLSQARTGKRSISAELAKRIEALTGFKASKANWPGIRSE